MAESLEGICFLNVCGMCSLVVWPMLKVDLLFDSLHMERQW